MRKTTIFSAIALAGFLLGASSTANAQVSFGIQIGPPPAPQAYVVPAQPGPDYDWVEGYWYPDRGHYRWHNGYWTRPPYAGAYWVDPYYDRGRYFTGHWEGNRGRLEHDHRWDRNARRDENRGGEHRNARGDHDRDYRH